MATEKVRRCFLFVLSFLLVAVTHPDALAKVKRWAPADPAVLEEFQDVKKFVANHKPAELGKKIRKILIKKLKEAKYAYKKGRPCTAVNALGDLLRYTNRLIRGERESIAEELRNRGWMLRHNLLASLPDKVSCPGFQDFDSVAELNVKDSSNQGFSASVAFARPLLQTIQAAGEVWTQVEMPSLQSRMGKPGMPAVPAWQTLLAVPMGAKVHLNRAATRIGETIPLQLYPFQHQASDDSLPQEADEFATPPFVINESAYAQKDFYPAEPCSVAVLGQVRDLTVAQLTCAGGSTTLRPD